jgi:hypothetical protein
MDNYLYSSIELKACTAIVCIDGAAYPLRAYVTVHDCTDPQTSILVCDEVVVVDVCSTTIRCHVRQAIQVSVRHKL